MMDPPLGVIYLCGFALAVSTARQGTPLSK